MGPSRAVPCLVLLFLLSSSSASVLEDMCKSIAADKEESIGYNYCIKFFEASKGSATADKRGLVVIASKLNRAATKSIGKRIHALRASEKDKVIQMGLGICGQLYSRVVDKLDAAAKGVEAGTLEGKFDAEMYLDGAFDAPETCETAFSEMGRKSPLIAEDAEFTKALYNWRCLERCLEK